MNLEFIDHIVLMIKDVNRTESFYSQFLGKPFFKDEFSIAYKIGNTRIFFRLPYNEIKDNKFDKDRFGLNHLAFGVKSVEELNKFADILDGVGVKHSEIKIGKFGNEYIQSSFNINMIFYRQ